MITITKAKPPLERGDLYLILPGSSDYFGASDLKVGDDLPYRSDGEAGLRLVDRHKCGALEFVVTKAGARPE